MSSAVSELNQIPFENLIGGPLVAAVRAQTLAAEETITFIKEVGFMPPDPANDKQGTAFGTVRSVDFSYNKNNGGVESKFNLSAPVLSIVPIPYIRIEEMTIDFTAKLTDSIITAKTSELVKNTSAGASASASYFGAKAKVSYRTSATKKSNSSELSNSSREYGMNIHIKAVQDSMPAGLERILGILESCIQSDLTSIPA